MTAPSEAARYSIQMLISDWLLIDGTMDNHVWSAVEQPGGDGAADPDIARRPEVARLGLSVRRAGWDQIAGWPHDLEGFTTWPAPGQTARMSLSGAQWSLVVLALRYWADVDERMSDVDGAARSRGIATSVEQRLVSLGWSPATP
ncbi:hypothetical protein [Dactylosporangium sp. NPDC049140]|uniref:hypothetical protein n=1 Tax=Dactylosporangium sp. NPDC049140 TaxID=3155647 RepID=UPI003404AC3C